MIPTKQTSHKGRGDSFEFFPPGMKHTPGDGREPHAYLRTVQAAQRFPTEFHVGLVLFVVSLVLYLASLSWRAFPGLPTHALLAHLDPDIDLTSLDFLWGWLVRGFAHLPGLSVAGWTGLFGALCGAAAVAMLGRIMVRVGYLIRNEPGHRSFDREAQARRLSGVVSGLYLACSIPFWMVSTRSLPGAFHLLLLVTTAWWFSKYQHTGRLRHLFLVGLFYGVGTTEFPTFSVYLPLAAFLLLREMFRWRVLKTWRAHVCFWAGLLPGLALYPLNAFILFKHRAAIGAYIPPWQAVQQVLSAQADLITIVRFAPGFLVVMAVCILPWLTLFTMSTRSPWFYERGQVVMRLIFLVGLLAILFNAPFSPWQLLGMTYLMVTPYLLLAVSMGYLAGEFWILGEPQIMLDSGRYRRFVRRSRSLLALSLPFVILAGGIYNWSTVDGRTGRIAHAAAMEILDRIGGRDVLFSTGQIDESLHLAVWERKQPVCLVSAPRTPSPVYLRRLAGHFREDYLAQPLLQGDFGRFLDNLLMSEKGPARISIIDMPDVFREFGYLEPDGFLYRLTTAADQIDVPAIVAAQRPYWARMEQMARNPVSEANLIHPYQMYLLLLASKMANNLAIMQLERGDEPGALETLLTAHRLQAENLSVLLNLLSLARTRDFPEAAGLQAEWAEMQDELGGDRWALASRFGYVWRPREWIPAGLVWALSGAPATVENARRNPAEEDDTTTEHRARQLDQIYLVWGAPFRDDTFFRSRLVRDPRDTSALLAMCRLAMRRNDLEAAEAYITEALSVGLPEEQVRFDRALIAYLRGEEAPALDTLATLARESSGDLRTWMALVLLSEDDDPRGEEALKILKSKGGAGVGVHLALGWVHFSRQQWAAAQAQLEKAIQLDPRNTQAWEMLGTLAQERGNQPLIDASLRALLARDPGHYLQYQTEGVAFYRQGRLAEAETAFRNGILRKRDPVLLNNLAQVVMERGGDLQEPLDLVNEALLRSPGFAGILGTRGEILLKLGRYDEARRDLLEALKKQGRNENKLLLLALSYEGLGDRSRAMTLARTLALQPDRLDAAQKRQVKELLLRLAGKPKPAAPPGPDLSAELARLDRELRRKPGDGALLAARGRLYLRLGRPAAAKKDLQAASKQLGRNNSLLLDLALSYEGTGERAHALTVAKALARQPARLDAEQRRQVRALLLRLR